MAAEYVKVMGAQVDKQGVAIIDDDVEIVGVVYHPVTQVLNVVVVQLYSDWARQNPEDYRKECEARVRDGGQPIPIDEEE